MANSFLTTMYTDIQFMTKTIVVKMNEQALLGETFEAVTNYERYRSVLNGSFNLESLIVMDVELVLQNITDEDRAYEIIADPYKMTSEERSVINAAHISKISSNYVEKNNYYRQYLGLPNIEDIDYIYVTDVIGVRNNVPIHEMNNDELTLLTNNGKYAKILEENPSKNYLNFIGPYKLNILELREAKPFDIIKIDTPENSLTKDLFIKEYIRARRYLLATMYSPEMFMENDFYEGIMGVIILTQAIRNCLSIDPIINAFYNVEIMDAVLRSYGIESYFKGLPILYKRRLIQNLDHIISYKGTDTVLLEICKIFGYDNIKINRYHLLKTHNRNELGEYIFPKLQDGSFDYDAMYNLEFLKADISKGSNVSVNRENIISYDTVTSKDPLWKMTSEEITLLKKEDFNIKMSDYIAIEAAYNVSQLMFELSYFVNFLIDARSATTKLLVTNKYSYDGTSDLFTTIIMLMAITAKKAGFDGNVNSQPIAVASIFKFNLEEITAKLTDIITKYKLPISVGDILLYKPSITMVSSDDVVNMYIQNSNIYKIIEDSINNAKTLHEFDGYMKLKKTLFVSSMLDKIFRKEDGTIAVTYWDMLNDIDPQLAGVITRAADKDQMDEISLYILNQLQTFFNTEKLSFLFINTPDMHEKLIKVYFKQAVELLKYMDTQLDSIDIFFKMDDDASTIRIFDEVFRDCVLGVNKYIKIDDKLVTHKVMHLSDTVILTSRINIY